MNVQESPIFVRKLLIVEKKIRFTSNQFFKFQEIHQIVIKFNIKNHDFDIDFFKQLKILSFTSRH